MSKRLEKRLERLEQQVAERPRTDLFDCIHVAPVSCGNGRPPGLYNAGGPGSTAGVLLYDPALGFPEPPLDRMAPHCISIRFDSDNIDPFM
jgi:hypothetical protein